MGATVHDTAAMVGSTATAGGTVTYSVYGSANCTALISTLGSVTVTNGSVPDSPDWTATGSAGTDYFVASYSGDTDNASTTSGCAAEPVTVSQDEPGITTTVSTPSVAIGATVYDTATAVGCHRHGRGYRRLQRLRERQLLRADHRPWTGERHQRKCS